jgi:hypothetical protein
MEHRKKERKKKHRKKEKGRKAPEVSLSLSWKRGIQYFERRKHFQNFSMWDHFLPLHFTTWKTLFQIISKFLALLELSLSLAIYLTSVAFFSYAWAPHIYPLDDRKKKKYLFKPR